MIPTRSIARFAWDAWRAARAGPDAISVRRHARLQALLEFARSDSRFYHDLYAHLPHPIGDLQELPPVTKSALMASFDDWVTDPALSKNGVEAFVADKSLTGSRYLDRLAVWTTSGTSGYPGIYIQDGEALALYIALAAVRATLAWNSPWSMLKILAKGLRVAPIVTSGGHYSSTALRDLALAARPSKSDLISDLSVLSPLPELVGKLNTFRPAVIVGYPLALLVLAREQQAGRLRVNPVFICMVGEWLAPAARKQITTAFNCLVRDTYAASEFLGIAYECAQLRLHVNSDWVILEPVDDAYQPVEAGVPSHSVLLTNLINRTQPLIRYDLGDSITVYPDACRCGSPLPSIQVEGRQDEILSFRDPNGNIVHLVPMAIATIVEETPGVQRYQIIKTAPETISLRIEPASEVDQEEVWRQVILRVGEYLAQQGLSHVRVERSHHPPAGDPHSGKFRLVWSESNTPL
jgi:phenylacetate-coenzyme A ligase PaaK-like adenylate-forming protein